MERQEWIENEHTQELLKWLKEGAGEQVAYLCYGGCGGETAEHVAMQYYATVARVRAIEQVRQYVYDPETGYKEEKEEGQTYE